MSLTIHGLLERQARKYPDKTALVTTTARLTYPELNARANQLARYLQEEGVKRGDRVAVFCRNNEFFLFSFFALMKLGAVAVPTNVRLTPHELASLFAKTRVSGVLYDADFASVIGQLTHQLTMPHTYSVQDAVEKALAFPGEDLNLPIGSRDVCEILFTSGTTGQPKGVLFNHERILHAACAIAVEFQIREQDKWLTLMPLTHSAPLNTFFMSGLYVGTSHVVGDFTPDLFLRFIHEERVTLAFAAPVAYLLTAKHPDLHRYNLDSVRLFAYGGGPLALASYERVREAFRSDNFYQVYGLTESGPNGIFLRPEEHATKAGSIGKHPVLNMELRVVDESGSDTRPGEYGEILLKGDSLMLEYDDDPAATAQAIRDGWLYTGDIAYRDEDGYVYIVDRKKHVIISGGVNIYPREIEEVLARHPAVLESCVIGVPHPEWGETVKAVVVCRHPVSEAELRQHAAQYLADYKRPRIYEFADELPRNASGKVLKHRLKAM